jgi:hypothetical protein
VSPPRRIRKRDRKQKQRRKHQPEKQLRRNDGFSIPCILLIYFIFLSCSFSPHHHPSSSSAVPAGLRSRRKKYEEGSG